MEQRGNTRVTADKGARSLAQTCPCAPPRWSHLIAQKQCSSQLRSIKLSLYPQLVHSLAEKGGFAKITRLVRAGTKGDTKCMGDQSGMMRFQRCSKKRSAHTCRLIRNGQFSHPENTSTVSNVPTTYSSSPLPSLNQRSEGGLRGGRRTMRWSLWRDQVSDSLKISL